MCREYLSSLRERYNIKDKSTPINVREVVLICDNSPRTSWKMGLVTKLLPSLDTYTRSVELKTATGVTTRPISKLCPLEVRKSEVESVKSKTELSERPRRLAAVEAMNRIPNCM